MKKIKGMNGNINIDKVLSFFLLLGLIISVILVFDVHIIDTLYAMKIYGFLSICLIIRINITDRIVKFGPAYIMTLYTIVSSFGYDIVVLLFGSKVYYMIRSIRHAYTDYFNYANAIYFIGVYSIIIGLLANKKGVETDKQDVKKKMEFSKVERDLYMKISYILIVIYALILLGALVTGKIPLNGYQGVRDWFSTQPGLSYLLKLTWISIPTYVFFAEKKRDYMKVMPSIGIIFMILMLTGNRNEVLYPLSIGVGVYIWKRNYFEKKRKVPKYIVIGTILIVVILNPIISSLRQYGISINNLSQGKYGVFESLMEIGQQINPFSILLYAFKNGFTTYKYGMTIIVPTISILSFNLMFGTNYYNHSIDYNPTILLNSLGHYGRGFSCIAEIYYNFGIIGVIVLMYLLGLYMNKMENATSSKRKVLLYFQIMPMFMVLSRNIYGYNFIIILFAIIMDLIIENIARRQ